MSKPSKRDERDEADRRTMEQYLRQLAASGQAPTALGEAARCGHTDLVRELLQSGVDVNARDNAGYTPLMLAASGGQVEAIRLLLGAGADINSRDHRKGMTPLLCHVAAMHRERVYLKVVRLLLEAGADPNIRANDGTTALDWATDGRPEKVVEILRQAGAESGKPGAIQAEINLNVFDMAIRRTGSGYVATTGLGEVDLPAPERLRQVAVEWLLEALQPPDETAASLLQDCDLSYHVASGKDVTEPLIEVVIGASGGSYDVLQDEESPVTRNILSALLEVCPELGSNRLVRKASGEGLREVDGRQ